ncbi:MAG: biotin--[acetyl-CoA-carboxylase] ligase [Phycisphaeraceae bacterium]
MTASLNTFTPQDLSRLESDSLVACVEFHRSVASTNDLGLLRAAEEDGRLPLLILTQEQTQGRGRGENQWRTQPGALTFSLVVDGVSLGLHAASGMAISLVTAIAVRDALATLHPAGEFLLKWPNDVWLGSRKVAGILLERAASRPSRLVVGIGINVNNTMPNAAGEFRHPATSLYDTTGEFVSLAGVLQAVLVSLGDWYESFARGNADWVSQWRQHCLLQGREVCGQDGEKQVSGICGGIDPQGALLVHTELGTHALISGSIERLRSR